MAPTLKVEVGFALSPLATPSWQDVTSAVRTVDAVTIRRGRSYELDQAQAGNAALVLNNQGRAFDPDNTSSPYYPNVRPMQQLRISGVYNGVTEAIYTGFITQWSQRLAQHGERLVDVASVDAISAYLGLVVLKNDAKSFTYTGSGHTLGGTGSMALSPGNVSQLATWGGKNPGGTLTFTFRGQSVTVPYDTTTGAGLKAALEALPNIGVDTLILDAPHMSHLLNAGYTFSYFWAGPYTGTNTSDFAMTPNVTPAAPAVVMAYGVNAGGAPAQFWPNPLGRTLRFTTSAAVAQNMIFNIEGLGASGEGDQFEVATIPAGQTTISSVNRFYKIFQIAVQSNVSAVGDIGKTITVDFVPPATTLSSDQISDLLTMAAWPLAARDIETGNATLQSVTPAGGTLLSYLSTITESENGVLFVDRDGNVTWRNRHNRLTAASVATFSNQAPDLPYAEIKLSYTDRYLYNDIRITRTGGTEQIAQDSVSTSAYLTRTLSKSSLLLTSDSEAATFAQFLRRGYKDPHTRVDSLEHQGDAVPDTLWPLLLTAELNQRYTISYYIPDGSGQVITNDVHIESMEWTIQNGVWRVVWPALSPGISGFWILGRSYLSVDTRLGF